MTSAGGPPPGTSGYSGPGSSPTAPAHPAPGGGGTFARIQFPPDLVPTDIIGTRIYRQGKEEFDTELGPVVANFLLADEINRAPAKVQSALLEGMQDSQVSTVGKRFSLP